MTDKKFQYLKQLGTCLQNKGILEVKNIVLEYQLHIEDKVLELMLSGMCEDESLEHVLEQMLSPQDIADLYQQEMHRQIPGFLLMATNILILSTGILITVFHVNTNIAGIHYAWELMIANKWFLLIGYSILWAVVGFTFGQKNGFHEISTLYRYTLLAVLPNYLFMFFVLLGFQYGWTIQWFTFLVDSSVFVTFCIIFTAAYYPMVQLGHRIGVLKGV